MSKTGSTTSNKNQYAPIRTSGLMTYHAMPSTDPWYFCRSSRRTSCSNKNTSKRLEKRERALDHRVRLRIDDEVVGSGDFLHLAREPADGVAVAADDLQLDVR